MYTEQLPLFDQLNTVQPYILAADYARFGPEWKLGLGSSPYSRLYYLTQGDLWIESGGRRLTVSAGQFCLVPAGLTFRAGCKERAEKLFFHLTLLKRDGYDLAMELQEAVVLPVCAERLVQLQTLAAEQSLRSALFMKNILMEDVLAAFLQKGAGGDAASAFSLPVQKTMKYVRKNLSARISVRELAERVFISERTLNNVFHREMGKTVGQYVDEMVFLEAQRQLLLTDRSVGEISETLGFCDQFYFSRRFKERCGKTPTAYRKEGRN